MSQRCTVQFYKDEINEDLDKASNLEHLHNYFKCIPFNVLKETIGKIINNNDDKIPIKTLYFNVKSIDNIIPKDIIQYIISFQGLDLDNTKCVNKEWNKLSHLNEKMEWLKMVQHEKNDGLDYNDINNKTRIISSKRNQLTKSEKDMGFEICPVSRTVTDGYYHQNIIDISNAKNGDRYFIHPGRYNIKNPLILCKKNLSLIGIPSSKEYEYHGLYSSIIIYLTYNHIISEAAISIKKCHLRISGCKLVSIGYAIHCGKESSLSVNKSQIESGSRHAAIRIGNGDYNKVVIEKCLIKNSKHCIEMMKIIENKGIKLICKNNIFQNVSSIGIVNRKGRTRRVREPNYNEINDYQMDEKHQSYQIEDNHWKWSLMHREPIPHKHNRIYIYNPT